MSTRADLAIDAYRLLLRAERKVEQRQRELKIALAQIASQDDDVAQADLAEYYRQTTEIDRAEEVRA